MEGNVSSRQLTKRQNTKAQTEQLVEEQKPEKHKLLFWAIIGGIVGAVLATGIILGIFAASGVFNDHSGNNVNDEHYSDLVKKPVIYLYPETKTEIIVKLGAPEKMTLAYPEYIDGWDVVASPNGDLIDKKTGDKLYALYWEGQRDIDNLNFDTGFIVKGEDTAEFLEEKLEFLGLNYREREEFIVYWLPKLEANKYNYIYFATTEEISKDMPLEFSVQPDTVIRVSMIFEGLDDYVEVEEQSLAPAPERSGFTVVEWGGTEL